ncbi:MAG: ABC transporter permease [Thermodesulfobacteriota bacterium]
MRGSELLRLSRRAMLAHPLRSGLTALGIAVGIAAVVLLTSIGEGVHRFVLAEFTQFGTNLVTVSPGRVTTHGTPLGILGTTRPLTIEDSEALRRVPHAEGIVPVVSGNAEVRVAGRTRRTTVYGVGADFPRVFGFDVSIGRFLPEDDPRAPRAYAVLGAKLRRELFGSRSPLGRRIRVGGERYRVIGTMEAKGQVLGFDLDDTVYLPAGRALALFNREGLLEIDVLYGEGAPVDEVVAATKRILKARHGQEDFTITTQQQMLDVLGNVLSVLTFAVGALGGISLLVGGVGISTIMTIAVSERTGEIGLLRALGAERRDVLRLFLLDAIVLAAAGGLLGLAAGAGGAQLLHLLFPALPVKTSWTFVLLSEALAAAIGLLAGALPARRAAHIDPVEALHAE